MKKLWQRPLFWFALALLVRLLYLQEQSGHFLFYQQMLDEREIVELARNGFVEGEPFFKAPLYSLFIRAVMFSAGDTWVWLVRLIQHLCGALLVVLAFDTARRLAHSIPAAALVAGMLCFYGPLIRLEDRLVLDFFTVFMQSAMLWAMLRIPDASHKTKWALIAGLFAGLSWLIRPTLMPVLPILALWIFMHQRPWKPKLGVAAAYLLFPAIAIGGFTLRNHQVSGEALSTPWQGGYNFYQANKQDGNGRYLVQDSYVAQHGGNPTRELILREAPPLLPEAPVARPDYKAANAAWFHLGWSEIKEDLPAWMGLMIKKGFYLLSAREIYNFEDYRVMRQLSTILKVTFFNFGWLWPLALASLAWGKSWNSQHVLVALYLVFLGGAIALFFTSGRLRMPLVFPVVLLAAVTIARLISRPRQITPWLLIAAGIALSWMDWWGVRSEDLRDIEYARLSNAAWRANEFEPALSYADAAMALRTRNPQIHQVRGQALHGVGRYTEAAEAFERSIGLFPGDVNSLYNLGYIYYRHLDEAERATPLLRRAAEHGSQKATLLLLRVGIRSNDPGAHRRLNEIKPTPDLAEMMLITTICAATRRGQVDQVQKWSRALEAQFGKRAMDDLAWELEQLERR
jgi:4-amino-4-deoxy-L-arabinose transferase-like glycosyltransferase